MNLMAFPQIQILAASALLTLACAHTLPAPEGATDEGALSYAFSFAIATVPPARRYILEVDGRPANRSLLERTARFCDLRVSGGELVGDGSGVPEVTISAASPVRHSQQHPQGTLHYAVIAMSYASHDTTLLECEVWVVQSPGPPVRWGVRTPSDVECWPRPSGPDS